MIDLSIIIVSYNTQKLLRQCLESVISDQWSVISQSPATSHQSPVTEIIVVDNGSTDGSVEYIKEFRKLKNLKIKFVNSLIRNSLIIKLIENKENLGFSKAVNQGIKKANGETILLLNSDTQIKEGALKKLLEFEKKVGPAIIGLKMLNADNSVQGSVFNLPTAKRAVEEFWLGRKGSFSKFAPNSETPMLVEAVSGGAMAISREVIDKIGLLDEKYFMYFEDLDYCRRARAKGIKVWYLPEVAVIHEHGASGKKLVGQKDQWRRLVPSSVIYHGEFKHWLINLIIKVGRLRNEN